VSARTGIGGKRIAVVGVSDEETAHLRLLMRKAAGELTHTWRWGSEAGADLVVVDPSSFAGQMARTRATATGLRCAVFSTDPPAGSELVLQRPLKLANVVAVLNRAATPTLQAEGIVPHRHDFYVRDVGEGDAPEADADLMPMPPPRQPSGETAPGLDELLHIDPVETRESARVQASLDENTTVLGVPVRTARSEARGKDAPDLFMRRTEAEQPALRGRVPDVPRHSLRAYLDSDVLGGPARFELPDAPPLVLDPKPRMFHSRGRLAELEPYCRVALPPSDWQPLTTGELSELRATQPPQPYLRLLWLYVLVHSEGQLARHLDPGGTYRLSRWIEIERDFHSCFRIASAMLQPMRLHEIAAASEAPMADVFDVVNAFDAIGLIEWQPRAPRGGEAPEPTKPSLLKRLRESFKRP
jgi:hypothetical protein